MSAFANLKNWFLNTWNIHFVYNPYFNKIEYDFDLIQTIDDVINPKITKIYYSIKRSNPQKYSKQIQKYENLSLRIQKHNETVSRINFTNKEFNYNDIVKNPDNFTYDCIKMYKETSDLIKSFKSYDKQYESFYEKANSLYSHYSDILEEYHLTKKYNQIIRCFNVIGYIDCKMAQNSINELDEIEKKINSHQIKYYLRESKDSLYAYVRKHNQEYIENNKNIPLFDTIDNKSLDGEQRESALTDEMANLVVAGAGSGKTLTICGKVAYLLNEKKVNPNEILLLSYSKLSAKDLQKKMKRIGVDLTVGTFHKIGLEILKETRNKSFIVEDQYMAIIEKYFREEMKKRPNMLKIIMTYYGMYICPIKHDKQYSNKGELYEDLKKQDYSTLKSLLISLTKDIDKKETIKKERVKSFEELAIANWYFIHGIEYKYEAPYIVDVSTKDKRQYLPDFYLPKYKIYHEHYGIDKTGKANQFCDEEADNYVNNMKWKRQIHQLNNTICLETYSYEFSNDYIFEKLENMLKSKGVEFKELNSEEILNSLESIYNGQQFKSFINLVATFLSLYKAKYKSVSGFEDLLNYSYETSYENKRATLFLTIVRDVYVYYKEYLLKEGKIDFDDMILDSMNELDKTNLFKYKYIIVDEFQDISISRMKFLKKLISHGDAKLFSVGDDWQAIYRFSGCDLDIFLNYQKYFGASAFTQITTTHRNSQELQDIASTFIQANPEQYKKKIRSVKHLLNPIKIMYYKSNKAAAFLSILKDISKNDNEANVLLLGRNKKDFESIALDNRIYKDFKSSKEGKCTIKVSEYPNMNITYSTVHGSKGLEEDYVVIINADDSHLGFPNKMEDDELLDMVLSSKSKYEYAEERRLWYVALTRTRSYTYLIVDIDNPSMFVNEIVNKCQVLNPETNDQEVTAISCPFCKTGKLILRKNDTNGNSFYGCSNYPYCDYTINDFKAVKNNKRCNVCGDFMVIRKGKNGLFYGCHNFPRCTNTINIS